MAPIVMKPRKFGFIASCANGNRSFATGNVAGAIQPGTMIRDNAGTWQAIAAAETPEAILCEGVLAGETAARTLLIRDAEVVKDELTYPAGATPAQITAINAALAALGIITR